MLKVQELREIIKLIDQSSITEFNYEAEGTVVSLKKGTSETAAVQAIPAAVNQLPQKETPAVAESAQNNQPRAEEKAAVQDEQETVVNTQDFDYEVVSPMVGTFYSSPSPEDAPYVSVGSKVEEQSIVCIVEAMKLFNEIEAEVSGEVVEVLVENGELVEYGQPLFRVKKK
ncbi:acetyl-CoA carboxylase biotin carboxyl carrier protein [Oceanobacillus sp. FSL H7-0719]|uniref:acetyl-CoA carboxylase biotin carboxyl carrier protein n=1 Tax=Oceanobacillus sp. FSL H7-0719 TaxID=2954507 RepID=UPI003246F56F